MGKDGSATGYLRVLQRKVRSTLAQRYSSADQAQPRALLRATYLVLLGREPDRSGLENHLSRLAGGETWETVLGAIVSSEEFNERHRIKPHAFECEAVVRALHRTLLRRDPDDETLQRQSDALRRGEPLEALLVELLASPELLAAQAAIDERLHPGGRRREELAVQRRLSAIEAAIGKLAGRSR
jgi:hypothetical protein